MAGVDRPVGWCAVGGGEPDACLCGVEVELIPTVAVGWVVGPRAEPVGTVVDAVFVAPHDDRSGRVSPGSCTGDLGGTSAEVSMEPVGLFGIIDFDPDGDGRALVGRSGRAGTSGPIASFRIASDGTGASITVTVTSQANGFDTEPDPTNNVVELVLN
jgi:hypothetical protein